MTWSVDDAGFVRAPSELVYRRLTDVERWPTWWPGARVRALPTLGSEQRWGLELAVGPAAVLRLGVTPVRWRHDAGFELLVDGDLCGTGEFWLEPAGGGTVIHHLLVARTSLRWRGRVQRGYRRAVRRGLWGCKDALHLEARTSAGLTP